MKSVIDLHAANNTILGDRELLSQAINNIIDNAKNTHQHNRYSSNNKDHKDGIEIIVIDQA
jgi:nitrogen fixation/metabolism regulation signal transduction histidine kinase